MPGNAEDAFWGALLSAVASLAASMLALFNVREKWVTYRSAAEYIKCQYTLYCAKAAPYDEENPHSFYLQSIEEYMKEVHVHWRDVQKAGDDIKEPENNPTSVDEDKNEKPGEGCGDCSEKE